MNAKQIFGRAALLVATLLGGAAGAQASCDYNSPTASVSIQSPGSNAGVQVSIARVSAGYSAGSLRSGSSSNCNSTNYSYSSSIYVDNRYIGSGTVNWNTAEVADGLHILRVQVSDSGGSASAQQYIWVRNNWINPAVWNQADYMALNPDVAAAFGGDPGRTLSHWLYFGIREGRSANLTFAPQDYLAIHADIRNAFGAGNYPSAIDHYITNGIAEQRVGHQLLRPEVYNVHYYYAIHPDLQAAFPGNVPALNRHWIQFGAQEGRRGIDTFHSVTYMQRYGDLQAAFGANNFVAGIRHYLEFGRGEGRSGN